MSDEKLHRLVRFNSEDAQAIAAQVLKRVEDALADGKTVGVVACVVIGEEDGITYECAFSRLPVELTNWAADKIKRRLVEIL